MSLAGFEHRLCPILVERDSGNNGAPLFGRNLGEGMSANQLVLAGLEVDSGDGTAETAGILGHAFLNGTWEDFRCNGLGTPALEPLFVEYFLEILRGALASQEGKKIVSELMKGHPISEEMGSTNEQIELALWLIIVPQRRDRRRGNRAAGGEDEIRNAVIGQCPGSVEIRVNEFWGFIQHGVIERGGGTRI